MIARPAPLLFKLRKNMTTIHYIKEKTFQMLKEDYKYLIWEDKQYNRGFAHALKQVIDLLEKNIITISDRNDFEEEK